MLQEKKFLTALLKVAKMFVPTLIVSETCIKRIEHEHGVNTEYWIIGSSENNLITFVSRGYIEQAHGQQIEFYINGQKRLIPFFAFNWKYLQV